MQYKKDESCREKEITKKKFMAEDLSEAKKFIVKSQQLYCTLDGLPKMVVILNVHREVEKKKMGVQIVMGFCKLIGLMMRHL